MARVADVDGGLLFVARQHPDLDTGVLEVGNRLGDTILEKTGNMLVGRNGEGREVSTSLFVFRIQGHTAIQLYHPHSLHRLIGRWNRFPDPLTASDPLLALPCTH